MFCGYCGNEIKYDHKFCTKCGKPFINDIDESELITLIPTREYYNKESGYEYEINSDVTITLTKYNKADAVVNIPSQINGRIVNNMVNTFWVCPSLIGVNIPDSVTSIGKWSFYGCFNLKYIFIPESVNRICEFAFNSCSKLESIVIPKSVNSIERNCFNICENLKTITFKGRQNLDDIELDENWKDNCNAEIIFEP